MQAIRGLEAVAATVPLVGLLAAGIWLDAVWVLPLAGLLLVAGCLAAELVVRTAAPEQPLPPLADRATFYALPALLAVACLALIRQPLLDQAIVPAIAARILVLGVAASLLFYTLSAQRDSFLQRPAPTSQARFVLLTLVIVAAFVLFGALYGARTGEIATALGVGLVAAALGLELYRTEPAATAAAWRLAGVTGLILAQTAWALSFMTFDAVGGGAVLILVFYVLSGLVQYAAAGALTRKVGVEYGLIGAVGLAFVLVSRYIA